MPLAKKQVLFLYYGHHGVIDVVGASTARVSGERQGYDCFEARHGLTASNVQPVSNLAQPRIFFITVFGMQYTGSTISRPG